MRVLHINCNYMTTALHQTMVRKLNGTGVASTVFSPVYDARRAVITPDANVIVSQCFKKWDRLYFDYKQSKTIGAAERSVAVSEFDCIHAFTLFTDGNCAMKLSEKYNIPYVVAVRSTDLHDFFRYRPWLRKRGFRIMERAAAVFFLSQGYLEEMVEKYVPADMRQAIREKSRVVPNGIDDFWLENIPAPREPERIARIREKKPELIIAGRINRNKNQLKAMEATHRLKALGYDAHLTVVGAVENETVAQQLAKSPLVTCIPAQKKEQLLELYRKSDIFLMPSYVETFGLVYAEAMSQGLPVIYTRGQGFDGQFPEGTVGYGVSPDNTEEIVKKILKICENYESVSENGPGLARNFNWQSIVEGYKTIYEEIT